MTKVAMGIPDRVRLHGSSARIFAESRDALKRSSEVLDHEEPLNRLGPDGPPVLAGGVEEAMERNPAFCVEDTDLETVAVLMVFDRCGSIPVVESESTMRLLGIVTDRDIVCRVVAQGRNPLKATARDCMTAPAGSVTLGDSLDDACRLMREMQVRRVPVVDDDGRLCGIVALADVALHMPPVVTGALVQDISARDQPDEAGR